MIKILHLIHKYRGDYPLLNQQVNLDRERFRTVVCYLSGKDDGKNGLDALGIKTIYLGFEPQTLRFYNVALLRQLKNLMEREDIHVVNCQQHRSTPVGVLAALLAANRPSTVSTLHGLGISRTFRRKLLNWLLYKNVFRIIGISHGVSRDVLNSNWQLPQDKVVTVQNGLVYDRFLTTGTQEDARRKILPDCASGFWFGTAGRLSAVKNHETLLLAFKKVVEFIPKSVLIIAGDGELRESLVALTAKLNLGGHVHFLGFRRDIPDILKSLDVFVLPSLREGLPLVLLEAMASGLPVVASAVGGIPEVIGDGDFGLLVDPHSPDHLAEAMIRMAQLPADQLRDLGIKARQRALNDFSAERMIQDYERVYTEAFKDWKQRNMHRIQE
ncbi:glycosyltransferase [Geobacter sp.]|uniref:glycosyltransferase n=1 Tax=Geobacter sp. TaxID=46610 RepID=UPI0027B8D13B|nr:glycosyltransferase [Geobacter sp.]